MWLFLQAHPELFRDIGSLLHFAPEPWLRARMKGLLGSKRYVTADLNPEGVDLSLDIADIDLPNAAFDAVICSHVLEHVPDDRRAMAELRRVVAEGGWCLVMVPLDTSRAETYEDATVTAPDDREAHFWQHDHLRLYAPDIEQRLSDAGFSVEVIRPSDLVSADRAVDACLLGHDWVFLCR